MKLRNIFLASLAVCTMASCSKDNDGIDTPKAPVDAYVSFSATALTQQSKATVPVGDVEGLNIKNEKIIKTLRAYIFRATDGVLAGQGEVRAENMQDNSSVETIGHIVVKVTPEADETAATADQFVAVLLANTEDVSIGNLSDLENSTLTKSIENYTPGVSFLPMVSSKIYFTGLIPYDKEKDIHRENWAPQGGTAGSPVQVKYSSDEALTVPTDYDKVKLNRLVARVQVEALTFNIKENYENATFELDTISLVNVRSKASFDAGVGDYVKGYQSPGYAEVQKWICPGSVVKKELAQEFDSKYADIKDAGKTFNFNTDNNYKADKFYCYAFPNAPKTDGTYETALLITGKFQRNSAAPVETKNFRVILKDKDKSAEVLANTVYKLTVNVTGEGSKNEDNIELNAHVAATIEVAPWNVIEQNEEDTN